MQTYTLRGNWRDVSPDDLGGVRGEPTACVVRYGAFGDMVMLASVLPELKKQGFRVCVNTDPRGQEVIALDPNVDEWIIQDKAQVDPRELPEYWSELLRPMFERWVNLTGSIEGRCLASGPRVAKLDGEDKLIPPSKDWQMPHEDRQKKFGMNYLETTHDLAGVPFVHQPKFYASLPEIREARIQIDKLKKRERVSRVVVWVLSGSSTHKIYPFMDDAVKLILKRRPSTGFFFVGGEAEAFLAHPWRLETRIKNLAGKSGIRETMALAQLADVVVGPETGVMNAVAAEDNRKVVFLSHSSVENLTKHWKNTISIHSDAACYPCHQLHLSVDECAQDIITRMPICTSLDPNLVAEAVIGGKELESPVTFAVKSA